MGPREGGFRVAIEIPFHTEPRPAMTRPSDPARVRTPVVDDEPVARPTCAPCSDARGDVEVIDECGDGKTAVERIRSAAPELVLLDVQMPELAGLGVVRAVGAERMPPVVFVTAYDQYALSAFELHALDYVLKPVNRARFNRAIDRVIRLIRAETPSPVSTKPLVQLVEQLATARPSPERLAIRSGDRVLYLRLTEIDWLEAADDLVRVHVCRTVHDHLATLAHLEQRLPAGRFLRLHRSTIVHVERIREFQPWFGGLDPSCRTAPGCSRGRATGRRSAS